MGLVVGFGSWGAGHDRDCGNLALSNRCSTTDSRLRTIDPDFQTRDSRNGSFQLSPAFCYSHRR